MELATLAGSVVAILTPYVSKGATELVDAVGQAAYDQAKKLLGTLKARWSGDAVASDSLTRFEKKPEVHAGTLQEIVEERLTTDATLRSEVEQAVQEVGPKLAILIQMTKGENVTGLEAENVSRGDVDVKLEIGEGKGVTGAKIKNLG